VAISFVRAGELERRIAITRQSAPTVPQSPPPTIPPAPPTIPSPEPTPPADTLVITLPEPKPKSSLITTLKVNADLELTATVEARPGDAAIPVAGVLYRWSIKGGSNSYSDPAEGAPPATGGPSDTRIYQFKTIGPTTVGVEVSLTDGRRAYKRVEFTVVP
jgi:hypothetical protein